MKYQVHYNSNEFACIEDHGAQSLPLEAASKEITIEQQREA